MRSLNTNLDSSKHISISYFLAEVKYSNEFWDLHRDLHNIKLPHNILFHTTKGLTLNETKHPLYMGAMRITSKKEKIFIEKYIWKVAPKILKTDKENLFRDRNYLDYNNVLDKPQKKLRDILPLRISTNSIAVTISSLTSWTMFQS